MLRFMVRVLGLWCLAGGFAAAMIDALERVYAQATEGSATGTG